MHQSNVELHYCVCESRAHCSQTPVDTQLSVQWFMQERQALFECLQSTNAKSLMLLSAFVVLYQGVVHWALAVGAIAVYMQPHCCNAMYSKYKACLFSVRVCASVCGLHYFQFLVHFPILMTQAQYACSAVTSVFIIIVIACTYSLNLV
jgi:hypothetical protein